MVSNDVEALEPGESCQALLLTAKARVIAPLTVLRRGADDFLLLTEPSLGERVESGAAPLPLRRQVHDRGRGAHVGDRAGRAGARRVDSDGRLRRSRLRAARRAVRSRRPLGEEELERLRILARTPAWGRELDDRILPAEAGLDERAISFTKGCYPGQEPVARLHYRGHPNRGLRVLELEGGEVPPYDAELALDGKVVGRITSAVGTATECSRSPTSAARCRTMPCSTRAPAWPHSYTLPPRARSSGDRALPCGGRGRTFESCRAHGGTDSGNAGTAPRAELLQRVELLHQPRHPLDVLRRPGHPGDRPLPVEAPVAPVLRAARRGVRSMAAGGTASSVRQGCG